jgi:hypothetical protein
MLLQLLAASRIELISMLFQSFERCECRAYGRPAFHSYTAIDWVSLDAAKYEEQPVSTVTPISFPKKIYGNVKLSSAYLQGHEVMQSLRLYTTRREVASSRPDDMNSFYQFTYTFQQY